MNREITFCLKSKRLKCAPLYMLSKSSINHKRALSVSRPVAMVITSHHCCSARSPMVALLTGSHRLQGKRQAATGQTDNLLPFLQIRFTSQQHQQPFQCQKPLNSVCTAKAFSFSYQFNGPHIWFHPLHHNHTEPKNSRIMKVVFYMVSFFQSKSVCGLSTKFWGKRTRNDMCSAFWAHFNTNRNTNTNTY